MIKNKFKYSIIAIVFLILLIVAGFVSRVGYKTRHVETNSGQLIIQENEKKENTYVVQQSGITAFDLLKDNTELIYKEYDFGVFIEGINGLKANDDFYWAFYHNNEYGTKALDKTELNAGDSITMKYEKVESFNEEK